MSLEFAINGLGRIGRALLRITRDRPGLELVAVNELGTPAQLAHLVAHDSLHGPFPGSVAATEHGLVVDGREVRAFSEPDAAAVPWDETAATVVVDATGLCKTRELASAHLRPGIERVLVSANADVDVTICVGVNDGAFDPATHRIVSGASCTTNCLAPIAQVLQREFGIVRGMLNTVHSYNNDQRLLDFPHPDMRRARAAALNMIPTTTSAVEALGRVMPELAAKLSGFAVRVPTPNVSLIDLVVELERDASVEAVNGALSAAAAGPLASVLAVTEEELVSSDFLRSPESAVVDLPLTQAVDSRMVRVVAWYDNEWGHACRLADLLELIARRTQEADTGEEG